MNREVITADICRYLGNDALVRPGTYEDKKTGRVIQGYFVTAYRNLTSAMIADLKADSARWEQERRNHSGARYSDSQNRFSGAGLSQYPGSDAPGYSASTGSQPYHQDNRQSGYGAQYQQPAYPPQAQDNRFATPAAAGSASVYGQSYSNHPTNVQDQQPYYAPVRFEARTSQDPYQDSSRMVDASSGRAYAPTPAYAGQSQAYYASPQVQGSYPAQPVDAFAGRQPYGSTSQAEVMGSSVSQAPLYDRQYESQPHGTSHSRRSDRERDRDDRHRRR
ncbi:hypothetical protein N8I77_010445 [Diaporthe amygdali]|uniref:Transcription factor RfeG n=1 Tax=Phomopsis amygdali TaxID=1214568 RepID=A0AAD9W105_PHOAM|nr:hypothetical protein N8I77_010445 [Diaporthe amygdali]